MPAVCVVVFRQSFIIPKFSAGEQIIHRIYNCSIYCMWEYESNASIDKNNQIKHLFYTDYLVVINESLATLSCFVCGK